MLQNYRNKMLIISLSILSSIIQLYANVAIEIYSKDEGLNEANISKPRIYVENTGTEAISDFYYYYYFTVEDGKTPILEDYYVPYPEITLADLGNGLYRIRYNYAGSTLNPGEIIPDISGNVVGLHYGDWSAYDKSNDYSNNLSSTFLINDKIVFYASDGTLIYGIEPPIGSGPSTPPIEIAKKYLIDDFVIFSEEESNIRDRDTISDGFIGSNTYVEIGCDALANSDVISGGNIFLRERSKIDGEVISGGEVTEQNNVDANPILENAAINHINIPVKPPVTHGVQDKIVSDWETTTIAPGDYQDIHVFSHATITLQAGTYTIRNFWLETDVKINLDLTDDEKIEINAKEAIRLGDRTEMDFLHEEYPLQVTMYSELQGGNVTIGTESTIYGVITAPYAIINVYSRTSIKGALFGKRVIVEPDVKICRPPVLSDLTHDEWAYSPPFTPLTLNYHAVVPDATSTLLVTPFVTNGSIAVTVNGNPPDVPITLTGTTSKIAIDLNGGNCPSASHYTLTVNKSNGYVIYVNDNSPATPGNEDGTSWALAYKDLQQALNDAEQGGKEIWVAEGTYKPSVLTNPLDPRSATFEIQSGIEIIGGFAGNETQKDPKGSAFNTIISGDLNGDDINMSNWPPSTSADFDLLDDNVYHVLTLVGYGNTVSTSITGVKIIGGYAGGEESNSVGAGVYNADNRPSFEQCIIERNISLSNGSGMYNGAAPQHMKNCFFDQNYLHDGGDEIEGHGVGLYNVNCTDLVIEDCVFHKNMSNASLTEAKGGAVFNQDASVKFINCVFYGNRANDGAAIQNNSSIIHVINCTFTANGAFEWCGGITNDTSSQADILNAILWHNMGGPSMCSPSSECPSDLKGPSFTINYSCLSYAYSYPGTNNVITDPLFADPNNPTGADGFFGQQDDGLIPQGSSDCIDNGTDVGAPEYDITQVIRGVGAGVDIGAYEYVPSSSQSAEVGRIIDGAFVPSTATQRLAVSGIIKRNFDFLANSHWAMVFKTSIPANKYTKDKFNSIVRIRDPMNNLVTNGVSVKFYKINDESTSSTYVYQTMRVTPYNDPNGSIEGKPIVLTTDLVLEGSYNDLAVVGAIQDGVIEVLTKADQF